MSRYTGPRLRKARALGIDLPGLTRKSMWNRSYPPGQHGAMSARRRKMSDYKQQLMEKQKLRYNYGLTEKQMRRLYVEAARSKQPTGTKLLELLERRLDNATFRAGFAPTIPAARQIVRHGHLLINGKRVDIPSYRVKPGDSIGLRERSKNLKAVEESLEKPSLTRPDWIAFDDQKREAAVTKTPESDSVPLPIDVKLVVEYYSKGM